MSIRQIYSISRLCIFIFLFFWRGNLCKKGKQKWPRKHEMGRIVVTPSSLIPEDDWSKGSPKLRTIRHALKKSNPVSVGSSSFPWRNPRIWSQIHRSYPKKSTPLMIHLNSTLFPIPSKSFASTKHEQYVTISLPLPYFFLGEKPNSLWKPQFTVLLFCL